MPNHRIISQRLAPAAAWIATHPLAVRLAVGVGLALVAATLGAAGLGVHSAYACPPTGGGSGCGGGG
jgi:hypothetical protein